MLRLTRRSLAALGTLVVAISIMVACGESLPIATDLPMLPDGGGPGTPDGTMTEASIDAADTGTDSPTDATKDGGGDAGCTPESFYPDASMLENFEGLGSVSSVRISRDGGIAYISHDQGGSTWSDIGEVAYPPPPSPGVASIRNTTLSEENPAALVDDRRVFWDQPIDGGARRIVSHLRDDPGQNLEGFAEELIPRGGKTQSLMPWTVGGNEILYLVIRDNANNTAGIHRAVRNGPSWDVAKQLDGAFDETHPVVSDDELVMYFAQSQSGGKRKIMVTTRTDTSLSWGAAIDVQGEVNWPDTNNQPTWISPDKCTLIFTSDRSGSLKPYKIVRVPQ